MQFRVEIENVHPITKLVIEIDLSQPGIRCIVGKNGAGKTTLAKAIMNLALADTFVRTSSDGVFNDSSAIRYTLGEEHYQFTYDPGLRSISTRKPVKANHKAVAAVEMPAPHGQRFTFFRTLAEHDDEIRQAVVLDKYAKPAALIEFLTNIYQDHRFDDLMEVQFHRGTCCCFVSEDKRYLREDYFSSGEYFLINLYRKITQGTLLVVIDEIDISLDASTQVRLAEQLRLLCAKHGSSVVFTSHSLALMQTLEPSELHYLDRDPETGATTLAPMSFNGVKSLMFQFKGYDRYVLTEDEELTQFLSYVIRRFCPPAFFSYIIIKVGGANQVTDLMRRNRREQFLGPETHVISILDGDRKRPDLPRGTHCIPLWNVEKALWDEYRQPEFAYTFPDGEQLEPKLLYRELIRSRRISLEEVIRMLCDRHENTVRQFAQEVLTAFLCRPSG